MNSELATEPDTEARLLAQRLTLATDAASIGVWDWDLKSDRWYASPTYFTMLGYEVEADFSDRDVWFNRLHPEERAAVSQKIRAVLDGKSHRYEYDARMIHADGTYRFVHVIGRVLATDAQGKATRLLGVRLDITDRKRAEQHVQDLNRVYAVLSETNQAIVREKDSQALLEAACRIAVDKGQFRMAWIGLPDSKLGDSRRLTAHAGADEAIVSFIRAQGGLDPSTEGCLITAEAYRSGQHGVCNDIASDPRADRWREDALARGYRAMASLPLRVANETVGTFNLYAGEAGFFDPDELRLLDELAADLAFALEVHAREANRHRVEQALRESEERFRQLAENVQDVFWMTDPQRRRFLYVSPAFEGIWGHACASLYAAPELWQDAIHPADRARMAAEYASGAHGRVYEEEFRIVRPDGAVRWVRDRAFPVLGASGRVDRVVGVARDVTTRRALEEQLRQSQKMDAIGQLAGGVAHDFNNILTVIHGYGSLLLAGGMAPQQVADAAQEIVHASERAANLTRQLLAFGRRQVIQARELDVNEAIIGVAKMLKRLLGEDVRVQLDLHPGPLRVRADAGMLDQVLVNLGVNARDAMPGGGRLLIETLPAEVGPHEIEPGVPDGLESLAARVPPRQPSARSAAVPRPHVEIRVSDTGSGISAEDLPRIFEPFFTTKDPGKGTGLGLATVFGIVRQHHGFVTVESKVGRGTTFRVFLPALSAAPPLAATGAVQDLAPDVSSAQRARGGTEMILLVEDDSAVRVLTRVVLERAGYTVVEAENGVEAMRVWDHHGPGTVRLLLTDIVMPEGIGGRELAARLRERDPHLRVIFTSGYSADIAGKELSLHEGQNFIPKPSSPQQLLETVRRCLDG